MNDGISFGEETDREIMDEIRSRPAPDGTIREPMKYIPLRLSKEKIERMKASYGTVCLQDFSDDYHLTDKQKKENNEYYQYEEKMRKCKTKYRRIDQYINAWRTTIETLKAIADHNRDSMNPEDFVRKALTGKITVTGIKYPKYIGKNKKKLDYKVISEYIIDPTKDPNDFMEKEEVSSIEVLDPDSIQDIDKVMFDGKLNELIETTQDYYDKLDGEIFDEDKADKGELRGIYASDISNKEFKMFVKSSGFIEAAKKAKRNSINMVDQSAVKSFAFEYTADDFEEIESMDSDREFYSKSSIPAFKGSMLNSDDVDAYDEALENWEAKNIKIESHGRWRTKEEIQELEIKQMFEENGYDLRKLYRYDSDRKKLEKIDKKQRAKEKRLKNRLLKLKERNDKRLGVGKINTKKKKHKKNKDKTGYKKQVIKATEKLLTPSSYDNFDDYTKQMEGWDD